MSLMTSRVVREGRSFLRGFEVVAVMASEMSDSNASSSSASSWRGGGGVGGCLYQGVVEKHKK